MEKFNPENLYNKEGQVENPEIAREMANTEKPFREKANKKFLGIGAKKIIKEGELTAEKIGEKMNKPEEKKFREWENGLSEKTLDELESELDYCEGSAPGYPRMGLSRQHNALQKEIEARKNKN